MEKEQSEKTDYSSAEAVLLGALAPGVNVPTWTILKSAFLMLGLCLFVMLGLAFSSSDSSLLLHVGFLVLIAASLFFLLSWYISPLSYKVSYFEFHLFVCAFAFSELAFLLSVAPFFSSFSEFYIMFLGQTGLVSVEHQMQEMNLVPNNNQRNKKNK
ncbi:hypothetical protein Patl1_10678 [Pistacia atlantica]|uniref:Uncharacterized protein n=1 Tax=Pistacia atlantica TaxID=434234 RepID=A0ACC1A5M3_9ROSI|nr:hypothetical protein Patl1_10678 [Pistacia atlantica]